MSAPDDSTLRGQFCASRDDEAFTRLVRRHFTMVHAVARRRLGSSALADEVAQHVFTRLAVKAHTVARHGERLRAWLHRATCLEALNLARKEARLSRVRAELASEPCQRPTADDGFDRLDAALLELAEIDRELLLRRYWKGEDFRTIAAAVGRSESACHKRVERSLTRLGAKLGGPSAAAVLVAARPSATAEVARPVVERLAANALEQWGGASSGWFGAVTGALVAASVLATVAGVSAAWVSGHAGAPSALSASPAPPASASIRGKKQLAEREAKARPKIDDVLASIDGGRWAPLVAFLADATPDELRTLLEDRLTYDLYYWEPGDGDYSDTPGELILRQWAVIDPKGALEWSRGILLGGFHATSIVVGEWLKRDRAAALAAFSQLPPPLAARTVELLSYSDAAATETLLAAFPKLRWVVAKTSYQVADPDDDPASTAQKIVAGVLAGERPNDNALRAAQGAFARWAKADPQSALAEASRVQTEPLRTMALGAVRGTMAPPATPAELEALLPPSWTRSGHVGQLVGTLAAKDPDAAEAYVRSLPRGAARDTAVATLIERWSRTDPWRVLDLVKQLPGTTSSVNATVSLRGQADGLSGVGLTGSTEPSWTIGTALYHAALDDPQRALAFVPELAGKFGDRDRGGSAHSIVSQMLDRVMEAWVFKDPAAAMNWAQSTGNDAIVTQLTRSVESHLSPALTPAQMVRLGEEAGLTDAMLRAAIPRLEMRFDMPEFTAALAEMTPSHAEDALEMLALRNPQRRDELLALATVTPDFRRTRLVPAIARAWLNRRPAEAAAWVNTRPPDERRAVVDHMAKFNVTPEIAEALRTIAP